MCKFSENGRYEWIGRDKIVESGCLKGYGEYKMRIIR